MNLVFLAVAFLVTRRWFNVHLALIVTFVLAFSPHELRMGREVRMYGLLQLLYFSASALFFAGFEPTGARGKEASARSWLPSPRRVILLGCAAALFVLAYRTQPLAVNFGIALAPVDLSWYMASFNSERVASSGSMRISIALLAFNDPNKPMG